MIQSVFHIFVFSSAMSFSVVATLFSNFCPYLGLIWNRKSQKSTFYLQRFCCFPLAHLEQLFKLLEKFKYFWCCKICPSFFQRHVAHTVKRFCPIWNKEYSTTVLRTEVNFLTVRVRVNQRHSDLTVSSLTLWEPGYDIFVLWFQPKTAVFSCLTNALAPPSIALKSCLRAQPDRPA